MPSTNADERRPLLGNGKPADKPVDNASIERAGSSSGHPAAEQADSEQPASDEVEPTTAKLVAIMGTIWIGTFLAALDSTLIATLSSPISDSFHSLSLLSWLASAYFIATAALQPLAGKLTDIFGRRAGLIFSNIFFAAGNLICGLAKKQWVIILGRVIAGMGGGGLTAISTFVLSDLVPLRRRGVWQGMGNICFGVGMGVGGVFGGWMNDQFGWEWAFLAQVPLTVVSGLLVFFLVKIPTQDTDENRWKRIDWRGSMLLVTTLVLMLLGLNSGGNIVPWSHPLVLTTLPLSVVVFIAYVYVEANVANEPVIPVRLLLNRTEWSACLTNWFITMAIFGFLFYAPLYFQIQGYSATAAGERLLPYTIGVGIGSLFVGIIMRQIGQYWWLNVGIQVTTITGFVLVSTLNIDTPVWPPIIYFFLTGLGYSGMLTVTLIALISAVDHKFQAVITSASYAFRSTGSTIGITIASAVFQNILKDQLWARLGDKKGASEIIPLVRDSLDEIKRLPPDWHDAVVRVYMDALRGVFLTLVGLVTIGSLISLFMRENKLHNTISRRDSS